MSTELPVLLPPDDLMLTGRDQEAIHLSECALLAHNVAPDGKANPIVWDDPHFIFVYRHEDRYFKVQGLNPEMMSGEEIALEEAARLRDALPYSTC
jgi:hypothetical protein